MRLWIIGAFVLGIVIGYNYGALRNVWDWEKGSLEALDARMKSDKSDRLVLLILTEKHQYILSNLDPKYKLNLSISEKVNP